MIQLLVLLVSTQMSMAGSTVTGLSCGSLQCKSVNDASGNSQTIELFGGGLQDYLTHPLVLGVSFGTNPPANTRLAVKPDGTLIAAIDMHALQPGSYTFSIYAPSLDNRILTSGRFTLLGNSVAGGAAPLNNSIVGTWVSLGMAISTPFEIKGDGTFSFGNESGTYRTVPGGAVFTGMFAPMNGGKATLENGTLKFVAVGAAPLMYSFRKR